MTDEQKAALLDPDHPQWQRRRQRLTVMFFASLAPFVGIGLAVIWKITLPLSLPALASVSLYVFMIAWNEFLLAFMLLDDPTKFTLTRGIASLNSSEIPRQHLMAGSVIATVPIMALFLGLEKFMTKGLTAGSVKG